MLPHEKTRSKGPAGNTSVIGPTRHPTRTPRARAKRRAFSTPSAERSIPVTTAPSSAKKTLSLPSPQPRSSVRSPGSTSAATWSAKSEGSVPKTYRPGVRAYSSPHGLQVDFGRLDVAAIILYDRKVDATPNPREAASDLTRTLASFQLHW